MRQSWNRINGKTHNYAPAILFSGKPSVFTFDWPRRGTSFELKDSAQGCGVSAFVMAGGKEYSEEGPRSCKARGEGRGMCPDPCPCPWGGNEAEPFTACVESHFQQKEHLRKNDDDSGLRFRSLVTISHPVWQSHPSPQR